MPLTVIILTILAMICFLAGIVNVQPSAGRPVNWISAGLALVVLAYLVSRGQ